RTNEHHHVGAARLSQGGTRSRHRSRDRAEPDLAASRRHRRRPVPRPPGQAAASVRYHQHHLWYSRPPLSSNSPGALVTTEGMPPPATGALPPPSERDILAALVDGELRKDVDLAGACRRPLVAEDHDPVAPTIPWA